MPAARTFYTDLRSLMQFATDRPVVQTVVAEGGLRQILVCLGQGVVLPKHVAPGTAAFTVLHGYGTLNVGDRAYSLSPFTALHLGPGVQHELRADAGTELAVLVSTVYPGDGRAGAP
jgi:quercetin dioxygenase-like cupin family protein